MSKTMKIIIGIIALVAGVLVGWLFMSPVTKVGATAPTQVLCHQHTGNGCMEQWKSSCNPGQGWQTGGCPTPTLTPTPTRRPTPTSTPTPIEKWCHKYDDGRCYEDQRQSCNGSWHNGKCPEVTPKVTPTPTVIITPTPTIDPCQKLDTLKVSDQVDPCVTPTPTEEPTPEVTPEPVREAQGGGWSPSPWTPGPYSPAVCTGTYTDAPLLQHFKRVSPTEVELGWWNPVGGADKLSLIYGYYGEPMNMGVVHIDSNVTSFTITGLRPNTPVNAQLWAWKGECVSRSATIDP
jgi:hypothetical protein